MLQLSDRDISIHDCKFQAYIQKINVNIKFPCSFFIQWNSINGKNSVHTQSYIKARNNIVKFDESIQFNAQLIFDKKKKKYLKKQSILNLSLTSKNRPDQVKLVGRVTIDLSQVINNNKFSTIQSHKLNYCSVESDISFLVRFLKSQCLNKSISDLDKSSFHDLYSFKMPMPNSTTLNSTKQTGESSKENIYIQENTEPSFAPDRIIQSRQIKEEKDAGKGQKQAGKGQRKSYRSNENIILINERKLGPSKQKQEQKPSIDKGVFEPEPNSVQKQKKSISSLKAQSVKNFRQIQKAKLIQTPERTSSVFTSPLKKPQTPASKGQAQRKIKQSVKQESLQIKIQELQKQIKGYKDLLQKNEKMLVQKSNSISQAQEKMKQFQKLIMESRQVQSESQRFKNYAQKLQTENQSLKIELQKSKSQCERIKAECQKTKAQVLSNKEQQKSFRQMNFSLNQQIQQQKQKCQALELTIKEKNMEIDYINKKAHLIEQSMNHIKLLQTAQMTGSNNDATRLYQQLQFQQQFSQPVPHSSNVLDDEEAKKKIKNLENRVDSLLQINRRQVSELNEKKKLIEDLKIQIGIKDIQIQNKIKFIEQITQELNALKSQPPKLRETPESPKLRSSSRSNRKNPDPEYANLSQQLKAAQQCISQYQKVQIKYKQKLLSLEDRIKELEVEIIKCRDPSSFLPYEQSSKLNENMAENKSGSQNKSEKTVHLQRELLKAHQTISFLAKDKQTLIIEKNSLIEHYRALEEKFSQTQAQLNQVKEQLKSKVNDPKIERKDTSLLKSGGNDIQINQISLTSDHNPPIKTSQEAFSQSLSKLSQMRQSIKALNIQPESIAADPIKAILLAHLEMMAAQNAKITEQLNKLKITIKEPVPQKKQSEAKVDESIESPIQITKFSQQLMQESIRGFDSKRQPQDLKLQSQRRKSESQVKSERDQEEKEFIKSIEEISSKNSKNKLLLQTKKQFKGASPTKKQESLVNDPKEQTQHVIPNLPLDNDSNNDILRFSDAGNKLKGTQVPMLKKNTQSVWDMESNFSARQAGDVESKKQKSVKRVMSKHTEFMDDNQFRIMSIDDQAELQQLRIIVRDLHIKLKSALETSSALEKKVKEAEKRMKQVQKEKQSINNQYQKLLRQHEQSSNELQKVWKEKQELIYELMFGRQSSISKPGENRREQSGSAIKSPNGQNLDEEEPICISIKQSQPSEQVNGHGRENSEESRGQNNVNKGKLFVNYGSLTQINEEASMLEQTMLRLSNLEETFRNSEQTASNNNPNNNASNNSESSSMQQLNLVRNEINTIKESFLLLEEENGKLHKELIALKQVIEKNNQTIRSTEEEMKKKQLQIQALTQKLNENNNNQNNDITQINELNGKLAQIKEELQTQAFLLLQKQKQILDKQDELQSKEQQLKQLRQQIQTLSQPLQQDNNQIMIIQEYEDKISQLNLQLQERSKEITHLNETIEELEMKQTISKIKESPVNQIELSQQFQPHTHNLYLEFYPLVYELKVNPTRQSLQGKNSKFRIYEAYHHNIYLTSDKPPSSHLPCNPIDSSPYSAHKKQLFEHFKKPQLPPLDVKKRYSESPLSKKQSEKPSEKLSESPINNLPPKVPSEQRALHHEDISQSISEINIASVTSQRKRIKVQNQSSQKAQQKPLSSSKIPPPMVTVSPVPNANSEEHQSSVYYSVDDGYEQSQKQDLQNMDVSDDYSTKIKPVPENKKQQAIPSNSMKKIKNPSEPQINSSSDRDKQKFEDKDRQDSKDKDSSSQDLSNKIMSLSNYPNNTILNNNATNAYKQSSSRKRSDSNQNEEFYNLNYNHTIALERLQSQKKIQLLQKKLQELIYEIRQKQDYIVTIQQQLKSNMNLLNQIQQLKDINNEIQSRNHEKDILITEMEDKIQVLMKEMQSQHKIGSINGITNAMNQTKSNNNRNQANMHNQLNPQCSQCENNLLHIQSLRLQIDSLNLEINSNRQRNHQLSNQLTVMRSQNQNLRQSFSKLNQEYTIVQNKLQIANNEIDRVRSELAIRTINQSRDVERDQSRDGKDLSNKDQPRDSSHSHELLIVSKGIVDKDQTQQQQRQNRVDQRGYRVLPEAKRTTSSQKEPRQLFYSLQVKNVELKKQHKSSNLDEREKQRDRSSLNNQSIELNKKGSDINIQCEVEKKVSSKLQNQRKESVNKSPNTSCRLQTTKHWASYEEKIEPMFVVSQKTSRLQKDPQVRISQMQKARSTYEHKIKEINHENEELRDELIEINNTLINYKKEHARIEKELEQLNRQNASLKQQVLELKQGKNLLLDEVEHLKQHENEIRILHIETEQHENVMYPQSSTGEIRETAKFNPFEDYPDNKEKQLQHYGYKTELKVDWSNHNEKIRKSDRSEKSKTSDYRQLLSLGGDHPIEVQNPHRARNDLQRSNNLNLDTSNHEVNQSKVDLYQDLFFKDQEIQELKIVLETLKQKNEQLQRHNQQLQHENQSLKQQNQHLLEQNQNLHHERQYLHSEKEQQIQTLSQVIEQVQRQKKQLEAIINKKSNIQQNQTQEYQVINQNSKKQDEKTRQQNNQQIQHFDQNIEKLQLEIKDKKKEIQKISEENSQLIEQNHQLARQNNELKNQVQTHLMVEITSLKSQLETIKSQLQTSRRTLNLAQKQLTMRSDQINGLKTQLQVKSDEVSQLKHSLTLTQQQLAQTKEALKDSQQKLKDSDQKIRVLSQSSKSAVAEQTEKTIKVYQANESTLRHIIATKELELAQLHRQAQCFTTQLSQTHSQLESVKSQLTQKSRQLQVSKSQLSQKAKQIELYQTKLSQLSGINEKAIKKFVTLEKVYTDCYTEMKSLQSSYNSLVQLYEALQQENSDLKVIIQNYNRPESGIVMNPQSSTSNITNIEIHALKEEVSKLKAELQGLRANEREYATQINLIKSQSKQFKKLHPQEFSPHSSSILNGEAAQDNCKKQQILKLLESISKTFNLLNHKLHKPSNIKKPEKETTSQLQLQSKQESSQSSKEQELYRMINSLALRNELLENELQQLKISKIAKTQEPIGNTPNLKSKKPQEKPGTKSRLPSKPENKMSVQTPKSLGELAKQLTKKITELKLNLIKNLAQAKQETKQILIKQLNQINEITDHIVQTSK